MYKIFKVYMADYDRMTGEDIAFVVTVPAVSEDAARDYVAGNGDVVAVKNVTQDYPIDIGKVVDALKVAGFGKCEQDIIQRVLADVLENTLIPV